MPFTGLNLFWVSLIAATLLLLGLVLMTMGRPDRSQS